MFGHGFMNRMISKHLMADGWKRQTRTGSQYWSATVYRYAGVEAWIARIPNTHIADSY
ncbi:phosphoglycerate mutase [Pseudomonas putida]|nr:phosphoglycerate mutase [Pseudomonas putida]